MPLKIMLRFVRMAAGWIVPTSFITPHKMLWTWWATKTLVLNLPYSCVVLLLRKDCCCLYGTQSILLIIDFITTTHTHNKWRWLCTNEIWPSIHFMSDCYKSFKMIISSRKSFWILKHFCIDEGLCRKVLKIH